ncbi:MAG: methyltransferase domain-containing protein [Phycisphaerae bacterium]
MAKRRRQSVEKYHDRVAANYDHSYDDAYWQWHDVITWDHIKAHLPKNQRSPVLDLGCGTGKWAARLSKSGFTVTCVDISMAMLDRARAKLAELNDTRAQFVRADLMDLSALPGDHFSLAVAMGEPFGCTDSPPTALKQIRRLLKPDAILVATFDNKLSGLDYYLHSADPSQMQEYLRKGRTQWITRDREERFPIYTFTPSQLRKLFEKAGYEVVDMIGKTVLPMRHHRHLLEDPTARRAWMKIEKSLHRDEAAIGRASHLQIVAGPVARAPGSDQSPKRKRGMR